MPLRGVDCKMFEENVNVVSEERPHRSEIVADVVGQIAAAGRAVLANPVQPAAHEHRYRHTDYFTTLLGALNPNPGRFRRSSRPRVPWHRNDRGRRRSANHGCRRRGLVLRPGVTRRG